MPRRKPKIGTEPSRPTWDSGASPPGHLWGRQEALARETDSATLENRPYKYHGGKKPDKAALRGPKGQGEESQEALIAGPAWGGAAAQGQPWGSTEHSSGPAGVQRPGLYLHANPAPTPVPA